MSSRMNSTSSSWWKCSMLDYAGESVAHAQIGFILTTRHSKVVRSAQVHCYKFHGFIQPTWTFHLTKIADHHLFKTTQENELKTALLKIHKKHLKFLMKNLPLTFTLFILFHSIIEVKITILQIHIICSSAITTKRNKCTSNQQLKIRILCTDVLIQHADYHQI